MARKTHDGCFAVIRALLGGSRHRIIIIIIKIIIMMAGLSMLASLASLLVLADSQGMPVFP